MCELDSGGSGKNISGGYFEDHMILGFHKKRDMLRLGERMSASRKGFCSMKSL
jgi:hypothetical protein